MIENVGKELPTKIRQTNGAARKLIEDLVLQNNMLQRGLSTPDMCRRLREQPDGVAEFERFIKSIDKVTEHFGYMKNSAIALKNMVINLYFV